MWSALQACVSPGGVGGTRPPVRLDSRLVGDCLTAHRECQWKSVAAVRPSKTPAIVNDRLRLPPSLQAQPSTKTHISSRLRLAVSAVNTRAKCTLRRGKRQRFCFHHLNVFLLCPDFHSAALSHGVSLDQECCCTRLQGHQTMRTIPVPDRHQMKAFQSAIMQRWEGLETSLSFSHSPCCLLFQVPVCPPPAAITFHPF